MTEKKKLLVVENMPPNLRAPRNYFRTKLLPSLNREYQIKSIRTADGGRAVRASVATMVESYQPDAFIHLTSGGQTDDARFSIYSDLRTYDRPILVVDALDAIYDPLRAIGIRDGDLAVGLHQFVEKTEDPAFAIKDGLAQILL